MKLSLALVLALSRAVAGSDWSFCAAADGSTVYCGGECVDATGATGTCQEDSSTCANNILPPDCPVACCMAWTYQCLSCAHGPVKAAVMLYGKAALAFLGLSRVVSASTTSPPPPPPPPPPPLQSDDLCADFVWPPEGTEFCSSNDDCATGEMCSGCTASSCSCMNGEAYICTMDCRFTCIPR